MNACFKNGIILYILIWCFNVQWLKSLTFFITSNSRILMYDNLKVKFDLE